MSMKITTNLLFLLITGMVMLGCEKEPDETWSGKVRSNATRSGTPPDYGYHLYHVVDYENGSLTPVQWRMVQETFDGLERKYPVICQLFCMMMQEGFKFKIEIEPALQGGGYSGIYKPQTKTIYVKSEEILNPANPWKERVLLHEFLHALQHAVMKDGMDKSVWGRNVEFEVAVMTDIMMYHRDNYMWDILGVHRFKNEVVRETYSNGYLPRIYGTMYTTDEEFNHYAEMFDMYKNYPFREDFTPVLLRRLLHMVQLYEPYE